MGLRENILKTISYFDVFEYPLNATEIRKYLMTEVPVAQEVVEKELQHMTTTGKVVFFDGAYVLSGREWLIEQRLYRYEIAHKKYKRALRVARLFSFIPYIKGIAVCNTLAYSNAREESDIDLFIIAAHNRIWLTRLLTVAMMKILVLRPQADNAKDKICLSFYITHQEYNLSGIAIDDDVYLQYWVAGLVPIYNVSNTFERFFQENAWIRKKLSNWYPYKTSKRRYIWKQRKEKQYMKNVFEKMAERFQRNIMPPGMKSSEAVILNDGMLKMYQKERRMQYRDAYYEKIKNILATI